MEETTLQVGVMKQITKRLIVSLLVLLLLVILGGAHGSTGVPARAFRNSMERSG